MCMCVCVSVCLCVCVSVCLCVCVSVCVCVERVRVWSPLSASPQGQLCTTRLFLAGPPSLRRDLRRSSFGTDFHRKFLGTGELANNAARCSCRGLCAGAREAAAAS